MAQGTAVWSIGYWTVVDPGGGARARFVVVDRSPAIWRNAKPVKVYGPATRAECEAWARVSAGLFRSVTGDGDF